MDSNADYDFDLSEEIQSKFLMFGEASEQVTLSCTYDVMDRIIDRFGEDIKINPKDDKCFEVMVEVSVGSTFFSWIFNYGGKIRIVAPESVKSEFDKMLHKFD